MAIEELRQNAMMARLLDAMANQEDIGHYGRLTFVMVGQHFLSEEEMIQQLTQDPDCDEAKAKSIIQQVEAHGYNPPKPGRILQWMNEQDFAIGDTSQGEDACNVYKSLKFPDEVYKKISEYYQREASSSQPQARVASAAK
jgi:hypothetical protein